MIIYRIAYCILWIVFKILFRFKVTKTGAFPDGAVVACANHSSLLDAIFFALALGMRRHPHFLAKAELFENAFLRRLISGFGALPINRGKSDIASIKKCLRLLQSGGLLVIFPEGTRSSGEDAAKTGAAMLALKSGASLLPAYITPRRSALSRVRIVIGAAYRPDPDGERPTSEVYRKVADELMKNIYKLGELA